MLRSPISSIILVLFTALACAAQSPDSAPPPQSDTAKPAPSSASAPTSQSPAAKPAASAQNTSKDKKKPKKVWTNDEVSAIKGNISVVGGTAPASSASSASSAKPSKDGSEAASREKQLAAYRDQLRPLRTQLEVAEKKLSDLRNFKGDNTSSSGGINMNQGYSMTPIEDQIKQLEAKKIQLQDQIDAVESDARKNGFNPGDLR